MIRGGPLRGGLASALPLLEHPRYEVFPAGNIEEAVAEWVPAGETVTVTASPSKGLDATLGLTERLAARGYRVVPHLSARLVRDEAHLADIVARLKACGVDDVFVPAGDADPPHGRFDSALSLLEQLAEMGSPFARTGITGYPETHPRIHDDITIQAMWDKRRLASYIVSNLCFDPVTVRRWIRRVRARGVTLPLYVGLAGPVERARLLRMAAKAGASESARFLAGHTQWFLRFGTPGGYSPDRLLGRLGPALAAPAAEVAGLHLFTFNQVQQTEQWRRTLLAQGSDPLEPPGRRWPLAGKPAGPIARLARGGTPPSRGQAPGPRGPEPPDAPPASPSPFTAPVRQAGRPHRAARPGQGPGAGPGGALTALPRSRKTAR